jgi:hypothetical protein
MSNPDPNSVIFSSRYKYFLNKDRVDLSFTTPSQSVSSLDYVLGGFASVGDAIIGGAGVLEDFLQVKYELSTNSGVWHTAPILPVAVDSHFTATFEEKLQSDSNNAFLIVLVYFSNASLSTQTFPGVTVNVRVSRFDKPL